MILIKIINFIIFYAHILYISIRNYVTIKTFQVFIRKYEIKIKLNLRFNWSVYQKCHTAFTHETCHITVAITRSANVETKTSSFETTIPRDSMCSLKRFHETLTFIYREREFVYEARLLVTPGWHLENLFRQRKRTPIFQGAFCVYYAHKFYVILCAHATV